MHTPRRDFTLEESRKAKISKYESQRVNRIEVVTLMGCNPNRFRLAMSNSVRHSSNMADILVLVVGRLLGRLFPLLILLQTWSFSIRHVRPINSRRIRSI